MILVNPKSRLVLAQITILLARFCYCYCWGSQVSGRELVATLSQLEGSVSSSLSTALRRDVPVRNHFCQPHVYY